MPKRTQPSKKMDALLQTIKQTTPTAASEPPQIPPEEPKSVPTTQGVITKKSGKFSSIYLNEQDQRILRELSVWFAGQGLRINDTLVIRAALRAARPGSELLAAYEEAVKADRRFKQSKSAP